MHRLKAILAAALAVVVCCAALVNPADSYTENASATSLEQQISEYRQKLNELEQKENELQQLMNNTENSIENEIERQRILDSRIQNTYDKIATMEKYISDLEDEIADLDEQIRAAEVSIEQRQEQIDCGIEDFGKRLRAMYISGEGRYADIILNSGDFYDTLMRLELVKRVAGYDNQIIDELIDLKKQQEAEAVALENKRAAISEKMKEYSEELTGLQSENEELEALYEESTKSVEELHKWQNEYLEQQAQLNADKDDVSDSLSDLEKQKAEEERRKAFELEQQRLLEEQRKREEQERLEAEKNNQNSGNNNTDGGYDDDDNNDNGGNSDNNYDDETVYSGDISPVINMARSMVGGRYSLGSATPTVSDCSGLTMQCYAKIGIQLPHKASMQASYGRVVDYSEMQPGDLIFYGGSSYSSIYHVALYIGNGKIIHAEGYATGIVVSHSDTVAKYNHVTVVKRLVG